MIRTCIAAAALTVALGACASTGGVAASGVDDDRITMAEIEAANLPNAYELVSRLRRPWLRRDPRTGGEVAVYMDEQALGGAEALREIPAVTVSELRFLSNEEAVMRWGAAVKGGVIVVVRRR